MMNLPKQSSPVMRSISTVRCSSEKVGVAAQGLKELCEEKGCDAQCSNSPDDNCFVRCCFGPIHMRLPEPAFRLQPDPHPLLDLLDRR